MTSLQARQQNWCHHGVVLDVSYRLLDSFECGFSRDRTQLYSIRKPYGLRNELTARWGGGGWAWRCGGASSQLPTGPYYMLRGIARATTTQCQYILLQVQVKMVPPQRRGDCKPKSTKGKGVKWGGGRASKFRCL
jgi:hypothetical protein